MKSCEFSTMEDAKAYMEERGELKYWGREGTDAKTYVYTLTIGSKAYHLLVTDGNIVVTHERYV